MKFIEERAFKSDQTRSNAKHWKYTWQLFDENNKVDNR